MTDERIAELLGWHHIGAADEAGLLGRIRLIVAEAQAEQSAQIERMRTALVAARNVVAVDRDSFVSCSTWPDSRLDGHDQDIVDEYDALLRQIDEAMGGSDASE